MWTTLALASALASPLPQGEALTLSNVRFTHGSFGPERADVKAPPGDQIFLSFDIEGLKMDGGGKVNYSMGMQVVNAAGKVQFGQDPVPYEKYLSLGGNRVPATTFVNVGLKQEPGKYTINVTVTDSVSKASQKLSRDFEVTGPEFAITSLQMTYPGQNQSLPAPFGGVAGQLLMVEFATVGFERDKTSKQPNLGIEMKILDESGKATVPDAFKGEVKENVPPETLKIPMQFFIDLNRAGKFTVEITATDRVNKKTSALKFPLTVTERK